MMTATAAVHVAVAMPMSFHLDHGVILDGNGRRRYAESCGGGDGKGENGSGRRDGKHRNAFHDFLQIAGWRLTDTSSRLTDCSADRNGKTRWAAESGLPILPADYQLGGKASRKKTSRKPVSEFATPIAGARATLVRRARCLGGAGEATTEAGRGGA